MGRFLSPDWSAKEEPVPYAKLDYPQTLNLYSYVQNNPLSRVDKDGHIAGVDDAVEAGIVITIGVIATVQAINTVEHMPSGSFSDFTSSVASDFKSDASSVGHAISSIFSKQAAPGSRPGQDFTKAGKKTIDETNAANHDGQNKCDTCNKDARKVASQKGVPTPGDQLQRHHIKSKAQGGSGTPENGGVRCPGCHKEERGRA